MSLEEIAGLAGVAAIRCQRVYRAKLAKAGFEAIEVERKFMSAFVRARKPTRA
jgi:hypothetical protein